MYNVEDEDISVNPVVKGDTIWLTQKGMSELFDCSADNAFLHLKNIYEDGELEEATTEEFSVVQRETKKRQSTYWVHQLPTQFVQTY